MARDENHDSKKNLLIKDLGKSQKMFILLKKIFLVGIEKRPNTQNIKFKNRITFQWKFII